MKGIVTMKPYVLLGKVLLVCLFLTQSLRADDTVYYSALSSIGTGPEMISVGHISGFGDSADLIFENPAALNKAGNDMSFFFSNLSEGDQRYMNAAITRELSSKVVVGAGVLYEDFVNNDLTDEQDGEFVSVGSFKYSSMQLNAGISVALHPDITVGLSVSNYNKTIHTVSGAGSNLMGGLHFKHEIGSFSANVKNLLNSYVIYTNDGKESLKRTVELGYQSPRIALLGAEFLGQLKREKGDTHLYKSAGVKLHAFRNDMMSVRLGGREAKKLDDTQIMFTAGVGLDLDVLSVNYAYDQSMITGAESQHFFGISLDM